MCETFGERSDRDNSEERRAAEGDREKRKRPKRIKGKPKLRCCQQQHYNKRQ